MPKRKSGTQPPQQPKLIHLGTRIETVFAVQDDEGNVINTLPVRVEIGIFNESSFTEAFNKIAEQKKKIIEQATNQ